MSNNLNPYQIEATNYPDPETKENGVTSFFDIIPAPEEKNANWQIKGRGLYFPTKKSVKKYFKKRYDKVKEND